LQATPQAASREPKIKNPQNRGLVRVSGIFVVDSTGIEPVTPAV
jgi:hypothetical protein